MAIAILPKTGLRTAQTNDVGWGKAYREGNEELERRIGLTTTGDPNGFVPGNWYGQSCFDTVGKELWECVLPGVASVAKWQKRGSGAAGPSGGAEVGSLGFWLRETVPPGYIVCDGIARQRSAYPALYDVLPTFLKTSNTTFTLPDLVTNDRLALMVAGELQSIGQVAGSTSAGGTGGGQTGLTAVTINQTTVSVNSGGGQDTGSTVLGLQHMPLEVVTDTAVTSAAESLLIADGDDRGIVETRGGGGQGHRHTTSTHTHTTTAHGHTSPEHRHTFDAFSIPVDPKGVRVLVGIKF